MLSFTTVSKLITLRAVIEGIRPKLLSRAFVSVLDAL